MVKIYSARHPSLAACNIMFRLVKREKDPRDWVATDSVEVFIIAPIHLRKYWKLNQSFSSDFSTNEILALAENYIHKMYA